MQYNQSKLKIDLNVKDLRIGIVASLFNEDIVDSLIFMALKALAFHGIASEQIDIRRVPGAYEIPLMCKALAARKSNISESYFAYDCLIVLGCVIRGETLHFEQVAHAASEGVLRVSLDYTLPIGYGVLAVDTLNQAIVRSSKNDENKGWEAALAALFMIQQCQN